MNTDDCTFQKVVELVFSEIEVDGNLSRVSMKKLYYLFPDSLGDALSLLDKKMIRRVSVVPENAKENSEMDEEEKHLLRKTMHLDENMCPYVFEVKASRKQQTYVCYGHTFCSCISAKFQKNFYCKHLLACRLAEILGDFQEKKVHPQDMKRLLSMEPMQMRFSKPKRQQGETVADLGFKRPFH